MPSSSSHTHILLSVGTFTLCTHYSLQRTLSQLRKQDPVLTCGFLVSFPRHVIDDSAIIIIIIAFQFSHNSLTCYLRFGFRISIIVTTTTTTFITSTFTIIDCPYSYFVYSFFPSTHTLSIEKVGSGTYMRLPRFISRTVYNSNSRYKSSSSSSNGNNKFNTTHTFTDLQ